MKPMLRILMKKSFHPVCVFLFGCLVFGSCSGCAEKTAPQTPIANETPSAETPPPTTPPQTPTTPMPEAPPPRAIDQNAVVFQVDKFDNLIPWAPPVTLPNVEKRISEKIKKIREASPLRNRVPQGNPAEKQRLIDELNEKVDQAILAEIEAVAYARLYVGHQGTREIIDKARVENPNDFDTLITWTYIHGAGLDNGVPERNAEHITVLRQLYEMSPNHPYVLFRLAIALYPTAPEEALGYALRAEAREPRYIALGIPGLCYAQMGDYKKAIAVYEHARLTGTEKQRRVSENNLERVKNWQVRETGFVKIFRERQLPILVP